MPISQIVTNSIAAGAVVADDLANSSVTTAKIADSAITTAKIAEGAVVTADLANGAVTRAKMGYAGAVLQVVQSVLTSQVSSTATSYTNIGLSASITPTSSSNRILAIANIGMVNTDGNAGSFMAIFRGSTILAQGDANASRSRTMSGSMFIDATNSGLPMTMVFLDSPNTTSPTTYDVRGANLENSSAWFVNRSRNNFNGSYGFTCVSTLTLMEIAA